MKVKIRNKLLYNKKLNLINVNSKKSFHCYIIIIYRVVFYRRYLEVDNNKIFKISSIYNLKSHIMIVCLYHQISSF